jgi:tetratricopeptide (TPR) repeat protein
MAGWRAARAECVKKTSAQDIKKLKSRFMLEVLHKPVISRLGGEMRRILICLALLAAGAQIPQALGQGYPGGSPTGPGPGGGIGPITGSGGRNGPENEIPSTPLEVKPEKAAAKAYAAAQKTMIKVHELENVVATTTDHDKKAKAMDKLDDAYGKALDQYTEVLRNKNDMWDAWSQVGYIHLRLGAYRESFDDYNHALALKPDVPEAIEHRAEAYLGVDHLDEVKAAYMDLFFHARPLADQLMASMQAWLQSHRSAANGVRGTDIDAFEQWLHERDSIAKTTASLPN